MDFTDIPEGDNDGIGSLPDPETDDALRLVLLL
jgi:hypothetical protein